MLVVRHWLWGVYPTSVDWIVPVTKLGKLRIPVCHTALYRLVVFTDLPYSRIRVASVVATASVHLSVHLHVCLSSPA